MLRLAYVGQARLGGVSSLNTVLERKKRWQGHVGQCLRTKLAECYLMSCVFYYQDFLATQLMVKTTETKSLRGRDGRDKKLDSGREEKVSGPPHAALLACPAHS